MPDERAGDELECGACGEAQGVPAASSRAGSPTRPSTGDRRHDFDREIVTAARSRPGRRLKTHGEVDAGDAESALEPTAPVPPENYDLERLRDAPPVLSLLAWAVLAATAVGIGLALLLERAGLRVAGVVVVALFGLALHTGLRTLAEVCRSAAGLARRQRDFAEGSRDKV